jgi:hypothetical protein
MPRQSETSDGGRSGGDARGAMEPAAGDGLGGDQRQPGGDQSFGRVQEQRWALAEALAVAARQRSRL